MARSWGWWLRTSRSRSRHLVVGVGAATNHAKLQNAGADKSVVGLTIPTGYSFNLDGTCIYLTMGAIFIAQATNTPMSLGRQIGLLLLLLLVSKGAAGVTGAGWPLGCKSFGHVPAVASR